MACTALFVSAVLLTKDELSKKYTSRVGSRYVNFLSCAIIALTLTGMLRIAGPHTGASINPAVSISQTVLASRVLGESGFTENFFRVYILGPIGGAFIAGFFFWFHGGNLENHAGKPIVRLDTTYTPGTTDMENQLYKEPEQVGLLNADGGAQEDI